MSIHETVVHIGLPAEAGVVVKGFPVCDEDEQTIGHITQAFQQTSVDVMVCGVIYPVGTKRDRAIVQFNNPTAAKKLMDFGTLNLKIRGKTELKLEKIETVSIGITVYSIRIDPVVASLLPNLTSIHCEKGEYIALDDEHCFVSDSHESLQTVIDSITMELRRSLIDEMSTESFVLINEDVSKHMVEDSHNERDVLACCVVITGIDSKKWDLKREVSKFLQNLECGNATVYPAEHHAIAVFDDEEDANRLLTMDRHIAPFRCNRLNIPKVMDEGKLIRVQPTVHALFPDITKYLQRNCEGNVKIVSGDKFIIGYDHKQISQIVTKLTENIAISLRLKYRYTEPSHQAIDRKPKEMLTEPDDDSGTNLKMSHGGNKASTSMWDDERQINKSAGDKVSKELENTTDVQFEQHGDANEKNKTTNKCETATSSKIKNSQGKKRKNTATGRKDAQEKDEDSNGDDSEDTKDKGHRNIQDQQTIQKRQNDEREKQEDGHGHQTSQGDNAEGMNENGEGRLKPKTEMNKSRKGEIDEKEEQGGGQGQHIGQKEDINGKGQRNVQDHQTSQGEIDEKEEQGGGQGQHIGQKEDTKDKGHRNIQDQQTIQKRQNDEREKQEDGHGHQTSHGDNAEGMNENGECRLKPKTEKEDVEMNKSRKDSRTSYMTIHNDVYQFLLRNQAKKLMKIERDHNITIKWLKNETEQNFAVLSNVDGHEKERLFAENEFIDLYQSVSNSVTLQKVAVGNYKSPDIQQSVQRTMKENQNVLLLHKDKDVLFIGDESDVTQAKKYFNKFVGIPVEERHLKVSDTKAGKSSVSSSDLLDLVIPVGREIKVVIRCGDITSEDVDVIVNATDGELQHREGVAKAIAVKAGKHIHDEGQRKLKKRGSALSVSEVLHTGGYNLKAKCVIHAVGPKSEESSQFQSLLKETFVNCLEYAAVKLQAKSIAIPLISSGNFGGRKRECAKVLATSVSDFAQGKMLNLKEIRLVNIDVEATQEIRAQIIAIRGYIPRSQSSAVAENVDSGSEQRLSTLPNSAEIGLSHAVLVEGFEIHKTQEQTKFNLAIFLNKRKNGGGDVEHVIYPVGKLTRKAVVIFSDQKVAKALIGIGTSTTKSDQNLQFKSIEVGHHWQSVILDISAILSINSGIMKFLNGMQARWDDLGDGKLLLENQQSAQQVETYANDELEKWLNSQVDEVDQTSSSDEYIKFSISHCVIVSGFEQHKTQERTRDRLELFLQKWRYGGGDVHHMVYPFGTSTSKAVAIFYKTEVANSLIKAKKMSDGKGQNPKIYPFKVSPQMKTFILELGEVVLQLEPTLKDDIFKTIGVKGEYLKDRQRLMLENEDDVHKVYKHVTDRIERLFNTYILETPGAANFSNISPDDPKGIAGKSKQAGSAESQQIDTSPEFLIYQFFKTCHKGKVKEIERTHDVTLTWMPDKTEFAVQSNKPGDDTDRKKAEYKFGNLYEKIHPIIKPLQVTDIHPVKAQRAAEETSRKHADVLILPKEYVFIGSEENVERAMKDFNISCGMTTLGRHLQHDGGRNLTDVEYTLERGVKVIIRHGDITSEDVDVIVNAANGRLQHGGGVARALLVKAGRGIDDEGQQILRRRGSALGVSEMVHTGGYNLNAKYVVHAVGPIHGQHHPFRHLLKKTFLNCLEYANVNLEAKSIAIPLISSGVFGGSKEECAELLCDSIFNFQSKNFQNLKEIHLVNIDVEATSAIQDVFKKYCSTNSEQSYHDTNAGPLQTNLATSTLPRDDQKKKYSKQEHSSSSSRQPISNTNVAATHTTGSVALEVDKCPICLEELAEPIKQLQCGHRFCRKCIETALQYKPICPSCGKIFGVLRGNQPQGRMSISTNKSNFLHGYNRGTGTIMITYHIPSGIQTSEHPNPGKTYIGTRRNAYLPDNTEGRYIAELLKKAFDARLIFTVGTSITGVSDSVIWNDIHHKTNTTGGPNNYGYPDPTYLNRVCAELAAKGIE